MTSFRTVLANARRAVLRKGAPVQDADDLVQEAFLRVARFQQAEKTRPTCEIRSPDALLSKAAVNLSIDQARRRRLSPVVDQMEAPLEPPDPTPLPDEVLRSHERLRRLADGLNALPDRTRRILLSRRLDGRTFKEIAAAEDMSVAAVEKQVARATLELLKWLDGW
ncbi:RNA polymerase sigma factor [Asticcacaulis sp. W401b]|uniref:RNA polymerase sigma factor n=1 Tax=Asticcacaulis sp. W401b TaxID=3388666 RepID=UPI00397067A3